MRTLSSFPSDFAPDRGSAKYFHGRRQILSNFRKILEYSTQNNWGTTFLVQGAPGAGKTALLSECGKMAERQKWKTVDVNPRALWNSDELRHSLSLGNIPEVTEASAQFGAGPFVKADVKSGLPLRTTLEILRRDKGPLLLKLDEAQMLETTVHPLPPDQLEIATGLLKAIHNGELGRPLILMAGGLGTTADAFGALGISRFLPEGLVELGALGKKAERAVLHDWLTKDGNAKGDPTVWIDAIVQETHGWPQHILSYVKPALGRLRADKRVMTSEGLSGILEAGRTGRVAYYKQRVSNFRGDQIRCLASSVAGIAPGKPIEYGDIVSSLVTEYGDNEAKKLFQRFLEKGILTKCGIGYIIPIPSMHNWLVNEFACEQIKLTVQPQHGTLE